MLNIFSRLDNYEKKFPKHMIFFLVFEISNIFFAQIIFNFSFISIFLK